MSKVRNNFAWLAQLAHGGVDNNDIKETYMKRIIREGASDEEVKAARLYLDILDVQSKAIAEVWRGPINKLLN